MVFSGPKFGATAAKVLAKLQATGRISREQSRLMRHAVINNKVNYDYGRMLVKTGAALSPAAAAAAVFTRLAVSAAIAPGPIETEHWEAAALAALEQAGAGAVEKHLLLTNLKKQFEAAHRSDANQ